MKEPVSQSHPVSISKLNVTYLSVRRFLPGKWLCTWQLPEDYPLEISALNFETATDNRVPKKSTLRYAEKDFRSLVYVLQIFM